MIFDLLMQMNDKYTGNCQEKYGHIGMFVKLAPQWT